MKKRSRYFVSARRVIMASLLLALGSASGVWFFMEELYVYMAISAVIILFAVIRLSRIYTNSIRKVAFMFDSIENDDFAFAFLDNPQKLDDNELNIAMNRIKEILTKAKTEVIERERYYELLMRDVRTGIVTINSSGSVYQVNEEALRIFGRPLLTHINQLKLLNPEIAEAMFEMRGGEKRQFTFQNERGEVSVALVASEVSVQGSDLKIIAITDINNELAEKELESWMRLIRVLTHEIMNSLAPITSISEMLMDMDRSKSPDIYKGLQTINATGKSLISFVESYRKFAYMPSPNKKLFEIKPFLERAVALQSHTGKAEIKCSVDPADILVYADEDQVGQVIMNILKNAVQAVDNKEDGKIWIDSFIDDKENIIIEISNNGGMIPAEIAENIFLPFFTTKEDGSGVGLSISRQIMRLHGGSIRLTSNSDGKVTFRLVFG